MRQIFTLAFAIFTLLGTGCRSQQLARDQDHIRTSVLELHTNQIMDNLVRVRKGLPIVQLDYTNMTGTITQTGSGTAGGGQTGLSNQFRSLPASATAISSVVTNVVNGSGTATQVNQLTITAQPVLNSPEVYNAYLNYLKVDDHLRQTSEPPPCGAAIAVRWYESDCCDGGCPTCSDHGHWWIKHERPKVYYWIPSEYRDEFRRLALYTVAVRGQPTAVSTNFEVTVLGLVGEKKIDDEIFELSFKIDQKVPNDKGYMIATVNGRLYEGKDDLKILINTMGLRRAQPANPLADDQQTDVIILSVNVKSLGVGKDELVRALAGKKVGLRLENFAPSGSPTDRLLNDIRTQNELFRLNQFQNFPR